MMEARKATRSRKTNETDIRVALNLDGTGEYQIGTGIPFFDHMLAQLARHGQFDIEVRANSDLYIGLRPLTDVLVPEPPSRPLLGVVDVDQGLRSSSLVELLLGVGLVILR